MSPNEFEIFDGRSTADEIKESAKSSAKKLGSIINDLKDLTVETKSTDGSVLIKTVINLDGDWTNTLPNYEDWYVEYHKESVNKAVERRDVLIKTIADILNVLSKIPF